MTQALTLDAVPRTFTDGKPNAYRDLFRQQSDRIWNVDTDVDWSAGPQIPQDRREAWLRLVNAFYGLELMGLDIIEVMMGKATHKLRDPNFKLYLAAQAHDEARHVYWLDKYLTITDGHGRLSRMERALIDRYGTMASLGPYRVESWLTSTLFSENFAALFLARAIKFPGIDPLAVDLFRLTLRDEVRHVNFLNTVLPRLMDGLSAAGRAYLWQSQILLVGAAALGMRRIRDEATVLGLDTDDFKQRLTENLDAQFKDIGIDRFLHAATLRRVIDAFV
ncbi:MAG: ferritin-like domain-containing protein [Dehalococcoidia bacterium]